MRLTWLGHSAVHLDLQGESILIDPFLNGNPTYPEGWIDGLKGVDVIALTHGHDDHLGDTVALAKRFGSAVVAQFELATYLQGQGVENIDPLNTGGTIERDGVRYTLVPAWHSNTTVVKGKVATVGDPAGLVLRAGDDRVYHAGDTALFSDMALIQRLYQPKIGLIPIGDRFTMGPEEAAIACNEFLDLQTIIPVHHGTFDLLTGTPETFKPLVKRGEVKTPEPGETLEL